MPPHLIEKVNRHKEEKRTEALVNRQLALRRLNRLFPDAEVSFGEIIDEYTGFSIHNDFEFIRGRKKVINQLAELLRTVTDPNDPRLRDILKVEYRQGRILAARRAFRITPTLAALVVRLIDFKSPARK